MEIFHPTFGNSFGKIWKYIQTRQDIDNYVLLVLGENENIDNYAGLSDVSKYCDPVNVNIFYSG